MEATPANLIIGLSGKPRSGKDTVAKMLQVEFPALVSLTFGNAVKIEYDALHGTDTLHDEIEKQHHRSGINQLGDERRAVDLDYWIKKTLTQTPPFLLTDVRFPRELDAVWNAHGVMIRIVSDLAVMEQRLGEHFHHIHQTNETLLDNVDEWDFVIENNGTLEELREGVAEVAREIRKRYTT